MSSMSSFPPMLKPSHQDMLDLNEALMKSITGSTAMRTSAPAIAADTTMSDKTKEILLSENLKVLRMQSKMLKGRIEVTMHELECVHKRNLEHLTGTV